MHGGVLQNSSARLRSERVSPRPSKAAAEPETQNPEPWSCIPEPRLLAHRQAPMKPLVLSSTAINAATKDDQHYSVFVPCCTAETVLYEPLTAPRQFSYQALTPRGSPPSMSVESHIPLLAPATFPADFQAS